MFLETSASNSRRSGPQSQLTHQVQLGGGHRFRVNGGIVNKPSFASIMYFIELGSQQNPRSGIVIRSAVEIDQYRVGRWRDLRRRIQIRREARPQFHGLALAIERHKIEVISSSMFRETGRRVLILRKKEAILRTLLRYGLDLDESRLPTAAAWYAKSFCAVALLMRSLLKA